MKNILVLGGSGFVGSHLCEKLARLQWRTTVPTRHYDNAKGVLNLPLLQVLEVERLDEATLTRLVAGHDAVVNLIAILHGSAEDFQRVHVELPQRLARACQAAGVRQLVQVSALGASADAPSRYLRSKAGGETVLSAAGLDLTLLRPSVIFGAHDRFLNLFASLQKVFPVMPLAGADARFQPVWVEDVAQAIVHCLQRNRAADPVYELCGPEVFTLKELVQLAGRLAGVAQGAGRPVLALPEALGRLQAWMMELAPGAPLMSRDNLDSMRVPNVASGQWPGLQALDIEPASLLAVAPTYLGLRGPRTTLDLQRRTAGRY